MGKKRSEAFGGCFLMIAGLMALVWMVEFVKSNKELIIGAGLGVCVLFFVIRLLYVRWKNNKQQKALNKAATKSSNQDSNVIRSAQYLGRLVDLKDTFKNVNVLTRDEQLLAIGAEGEVKTLSLMEYLGNAIVYWNVGLNFYEKKCEYDILSVTPYGILHVEVKNYGGDYYSSEESSVYRPNYWEKRLSDGQKKRSRSPASQAARAKGLLTKALNMACSESIPILSVIVFTNSSFKANHIVEDRVAWCDLDTFGSLYMDFINGKIPGAKRVDSHTLGKTLSYLANGGHFPAFFDETLYQKDSSYEASEHSHVA